MALRRGVRSFKLPNPSQLVSEPLLKEDVLFGRGSPISLREGNIAFRKIVRGRKEEYAGTTPYKEKHRIAMEIFMVITERGGRFLRRVESFELSQLGLPLESVYWAIVEKDVALEKIKQALRDREPVSQSTQGKRKAASLADSAETKCDSTAAHYTPSAVQPQVAMTGQDVSNNLWSSAENTQVSPHFLVSLMNQVNLLGMLQKDSSAIPCQTPPSFAVRTTSGATQVANAVQHQELSSLLSSMGTNGVTSNTPAQWGTSQHNQEVGKTPATSSNNPSSGTTTQQHILPFGQVSAQGTEQLLQDLPSLLAWLGQQESLRQKASQANELVLSMTPAPSSSTLNNCPLVSQLGAVLPTGQTISALPPPMESSVNQCAAPNALLGNPYLAGIFHSASHLAAQPNPCGGTNTEALPNPSVAAAEALLTSLFSQSEQPEGKREDTACNTTDDSSQ